MSKLLTKQQIQNANDLRTEIVNCPEWGGDVKVRSLTAAERDDFEDEVHTEDGLDRQNIRARLCVRSMIDESGDPVFELDDFVILGAKSAKPVDRIFAACQRLSGITDDDVAELEKNSADAPSESSTSE